MTELYTKSTKSIRCLPEIDSSKGVFFPCGRAVGAQTRDLSAGGLLAYLADMEAEQLIERVAARLRRGGEPAAQAIVDEIWVAVVEGSLDVGQRLPTVREVAIGLGVTPRSVERAYRELERRGVVVTRPGAGSFISLTQPSEQERARHQELTRLSREAVARANELGFTVDDLLDAIADFRTSDETRKEGPRT